MILQLPKILSQVGRVFGICEKNLPMRHRDINLLALPFPMYRPCIKHQIIFLSNVCIRVFLTNAWIIHVRAKLGNHRMWSWTTFFRWAVFEFCKTLLSDKIRKRWLTFQVLQIESVSLIGFAHIQTLQGWRKSWGAPLCCLRCDIFPNIIIIATKKVKIPLKGFFS